MEGLVDYVRRQVKCPECRAEHRIPYNGVQGFPSNVTLQRFLEAHIEITGETPDPHTGQYMERCNVCNEKNYLSVCAHCEKKICEDCKAAHTDILKREIGRINNQVKRAAHRLNDQLSTVERNIVSLKQNTGSVSEEIEGICKRLQKSVRDRCDFLKAEVEIYYINEAKNLTTLKESLDQEVSNINSNIELAEKHMDDHTPWDDAELMDTKDIFLKTMEFIRSFDYEAGDYSRRARFNPPDDLNKIATSLNSLGELSFHPSNKVNDGYNSVPAMGSGLMKSKSDHRLASQFRDQEDSYSGYSSGRTSPLMRKRFGERTVERHDEDTPADSGRRRFRSRFMRKEEDEDRAVRLSEEDGPKRPRVFDTEDVSRGPLSGIVRLYDSPRVMKRFQERDQLKNKKKEEPTPKPAQQPTLPKPPATPVQRKTSRQTSEDEIDKIKKQNKAADTSSSAGATATSPTMSTSTPSTPTTPKPAGERVSTIREDERQSRIDRASTSPRSSANHSPTSSITREDDASRRREYSGSRTDSIASGSNGATSRTASSRKTSVDTGVTSVGQRSYPFSRSSSNSSVGDKDKSTSGTRSPRQIDTASIERRLSRSNSTDSNKSIDGATSPKKNTGAAFSTDELKNRFVRSDSKPSTSTTTSKPDTSRSNAPSSSRFQSRFLGRAGTPSVEASKESGNDDEDETSEDSESEESEESSEEDEEEEEEEEEKTTSEYSRPDIGSLLGRSAQSRDKASSTSTSSRWSDRSSYPPATSTVADSGYGSSRYGSNSDNSNGSTSSSRYGTSSASSISNDSGVSTHRRPSYLEAKSQAKEKDEDFESKYPYSSKYLSRSRAAVPEEEAKPSFQSRFLNRSKSSAVLGPDDASEDTAGSSTHGSGRARFEELKERRQRLARSKSSAGLEDEESTTADSNSAAKYRPRYGRSEPETSPTSRSPSTGTTAASSTSASSNSGGGEEGGSSTQQLSNWARYLKNKYGNRSNAGGESVGRSTLGSGASGTSSGLGGSSSSSGASSLLGSQRSGTSTAGGRAISRSRSSHLFGLAKEGESSEDDSKNVHATPTSPPAGMVVPTPFGSIHRSQYLQKQCLLLKIGSRGSDQGNFTWPRGIAVGPDNSIVVADSSNHRVQVFDQQGKFIKEFGSYGNAEGEFDCLAGVAVNRIGQFIIADRYNHRIQVFDPSGNFLRSFGSQGGGDGRFSYPWGVTTDALGFIYVCDKENHRVQVFQSDGSFVGKFGSMGSKPGQLEHPHYIAVSSTNRVIVSDSNNHRVQIFDINGKVTTTFGSEGSDEGLFKFPRGVAVDDQGYIFVADSGNNRIQIFHPDGTFLRAFGCWGSSEGEFKGLEGVAVMSNGNILVCDRENHRVQVF